MKIAVCVRRGEDGLNPFEASAYEQALRLGGEVTLVSLGPPDTADWLRQLTRQGASRAVLLTDPSFAGSDTLATAKLLTAALRKLNPDLVLCGRKTMMGDTAQVPPMTAALLGWDFCPEVLSLTEQNCQTRTGERPLMLPAVAAVERSCDLRLPSIFSKTAEVAQWSARELDVPADQCGLTGSPTRVIEARENDTGLRHCQFLPPEQFPWALQQRKAPMETLPPCGKKLSTVCVVGDIPIPAAAAVGERVLTLPAMPAPVLAEKLRTLDPDAVLFPTDTASRRLAAETAVLLDTGLCADCTALDTDGETLHMIRPARSGTVMAKVRCLRRPAMATVCTGEATEGQLILTAGYGAAGDLPGLQKLAKALGAELCASRKAVDNGLLPYGAQVGLTGRTVAPQVYVALGVSGAVHHLVGMAASGVVIAVNPDRKAPIFRYADYGFVTEIKTILNIFKEDGYEL